jgi:hypothetical protein
VLNLKEQNSVIYRAKRVTELNEKDTPFIYFCYLTTHKSSSLKTMFKDVSKKTQYIKKLMMFKKRKS